MLKKIILSIGSFCCLAGALTAQITTNTRVLNQAAAGFRLAFSANYAKAIDLAKKRGWDLTFKTRNGGVAVLVGVDDLNHPKYYITNNNTIAAATTRASQLWPGGSSGLNLNGSSSFMKNKIGIWDGGGVLGTHAELTGRVTQKDVPATTLSDHATHVSGTMVASGVNPSAKGMAYGVQGLIAYDFTNDLSEIASEAANLLVSNHSYSIIAGWNYNSSQSRWEFNGDPNATEDYKFGYYSSDAQVLDSIAYNAPYYLIVKSAGNNRDENGPAVGSPYYRKNASGQFVSAGNRPAGISSNDSYDIISWDCGAKNILTVGAVNGIPTGYSRKEDVVMSSFSSWGPTDDGRIKPDVVADGVNVLSPISSSNTAYATYSGTSMSSPNAAGSLFLLQEYYAKLKNSTTTFLRSASLKGLAIHTADEAGDSPGPDYKFGWGLLNVQKAADVLTAAVPSNNAATSAHQLYENTLTQGQTFTTNVIASGKGPLIATICWTDVKGTVEATGTLNSRNKKLVNDLDIRVTKGSGSSLVTYSPWTLDVNNPSSAAIKGDNITDNVERVDIDSTVPGQTYTITVTHKGTLARGSQAYSLLVSGVGGTAYCTSAPSSNTGSRIDSVVFKTIAIANPAGNTTYTDYTNNVADIEPGQTIPIRVRVGSSDGTNAAKMVKVFIDYNNNGTFDSNELVASSSSSLTNGSVFTANVTTPSTITIGNIYLMRIVVQETSNASDVNACGTYTKGETEDFRVRVVSPSNDVALNTIVSPTGGDCASGAQYMTVTIRNNGSVSQSNIPITASIASGGTVLSTLSFTYPGPIAPLTSANYTFQSPFVTAAGTTYTITATASLSTDQYPANNSLVSVFATSAKPTISAAAEICPGTTPTAYLKVNNADATANYFWYSTATSNSAFATGSTVSTTTIPTDKTFYVTKEAKTGIGPATRTTLGTSGGYNMFIGNYVKINNSVPLVIESSRLYIGYPGKIRFTLANILSTTSTGFTYQPLAATTIDVYPTTPSPGATTNAVSTNDTGAVYYLNLPVNSTGDHIIMVECLDKNGNMDTVSNLGATIFRNNNLTGATYPISIPNILSITGNSASGQEAAFYYFFYDMKINTGACMSDRISVVAANATVPTITQQADSLVCNITSGLQWYLNDTAINGANKGSYKPTKSGKYKVVVLDAFGCAQTSSSITYTVTATADVQAEEIKLKVSPNPNNGVFNLSFEVSTKADLSISMLSESGQQVYNRTYSGFSGKFNKQISLDPVSSAFYILKIQHDKKTYVKKVLIQR
jgi:hypothetical protein